MSPHYELVMKYSAQLFIGFFCLNFILIVRGINTIMQLHIRITFEIFFIIFVVIIVSLLVLKN